MLPDSVGIEAYLAVAGKEVEAVAGQNCIRSYLIEISIAARGRNSQQRQA
jgi:hypothetical protein